MAKEKTNLETLKDANVKVCLLTRQTEIRAAINALRFKNMLEWPSQSSNINPLKNVCKATVLKFF